MTTKSYVGDTGTVITLDCGADVSSATARAIEVRKPDRTTVSWAAVASGTNSIAYTTLADTFDQAGTWMLQARVAMPGGQWRGETVALEVAEVFE